MTQMLTLSNDIVHLSLVPEFGARITSLIDLRSGRDWLVSGANVGSRDDDAEFRGENAIGWDECFPTVAPCQSKEWGGSLRDHGDIWARVNECEVSDYKISSKYTSERYSFERTLALEGNCLTVDYQVTNTSDLNLPYMWSQHCLLAGGPGDQLFLNDIARMNVTGVLGHKTDAPNQFEWPYFTQERPDLSSVDSIEEAWAMKAYAPVSDQITAGLHGSEGAIQFEWNKGQLPYLGLWLDYGGWPLDKQNHQFAIEPTTAPSDDLKTALEAGHARWLAPLKTHQWQVAIRLLDNSRMEENYE